MDGLADQERDQTAAYPSEAQLLDVLYEVLAQGPPTRGGGHEPGLTRADVERFLHEHARVRKPREELLRFLNEHGLPTEASEVGADQELAVLARGLQRAQRSASLPAPQLPGALEQGNDTAVDEIEDETTSPRVLAPTALLGPLPTVTLAKAGSAPTIPRLLLALSTLAIGLAIALLLSHLRAERLAGQLATAQLGRQNAEQRERPLRAELQRVRSELAARSAEQQRVTAQLGADLAARDQAHAAAAARYAAETLALEHAFGPRYRLARRQLAQVGVQPPF